LAPGYGFQGHLSVNSSLDLIRLVGEELVHQIHYLWVIIDYEETVMRWCDTP